MQNFILFLLLVPKFDKYDFGENLKLYKIIIIITNPVFLAFILNTALYLKVKKRKAFAFLQYLYLLLLFFFVFKPGQSGDIFGDEIGQDSAPLAEYRLKHAILACLHLFLATNSIRSNSPIGLVLFCILCFDFLIKCFISLLQQTQISIQKRLLSNVYTIGI